MNLTRRSLATVMAAALLTGLAPAPVVGAIPMASSEPVPIINEDAGPTTVTLTAVDPDGGFITGFVISKHPAKGGLGTPSIPTCGAPGDPCIATVVYTPDTDANGDDSFEFTAIDDNLPSETSATATVAITITPVNDAPSFTKGADQSVAEDAGPQSVTGWATSISPGPADEAAQAVSFSVTNDANALFSVQPAIAPTGTLTYTPAPNANGSATVSVHVTDDGGTASGGDDTSPTQTFTITVTPVNDAPSFTQGADQSVAEDAGAKSVTGWATGTPGPANEAGQALAYVIDSVTNASLFSVAPAVSPTGTLTYTPAANANGTSAVTLHLTDNGGGTSASATQQFTVTVTPVNDAPTPIDDTASVPEDAVDFRITPDPWLNDLSDPDGGETIAMTDFGQPGHGTVTKHPNQGYLRYTPMTNYNGADSFTYTISDGNGGTATATVAITITPVNDPPTAADDTWTVPEDAGATAINVLANDSTAPDTGETLAITGVTDAPKGSVAIVGGTGVTYTPDHSANGADSFTYTISDGNGGTATATVAITITPVNDPPTAADDTWTVPEDAGATAINVLANDSTAPDTGETLAITGVTDAPKGSVAVVGGTSVTYTPDHSANGADSFTYTISDGNGGTATATVAITITPVNDAPSFTKGADQSVAEDAGPARSPAGRRRSAPAPPTRPPRPSASPSPTTRTRCSASSRPSLPRAPSPTPRWPTPTARPRSWCASSTTGVPRAVGATRQRPSSSRSPSRRSTTHPRSPRARTSPSPRTQAPGR